jgi:polyisoprenoid-binding protein YceI
LIPTLKVTEDHKAKRCLPDNYIKKYVDMEETMLKKILVVGAVIAIVAIGIVVYAFLKTPEEASGPIEAIPITTDDKTTATDTASETATETPPAAEEVVPTEEPETQTDTGPEAETGEATDDTAADAGAVTESEMEGGADNTTNPDTEAKPTSETDAGTSGEPTESGEAATALPIIFEIIPAESEARFYIDEVLRGEPITVVGATDQVAGQFAVNPNDLSITEVGVIQVNARTLATDNQFRNRAIKNRILLTDDYEFITFTPQDVIGLPETGTVGETYTFQIVGNLAITDVTQQKTFDVTATAVSDTRLEATATTAFPYTDFELFIPDAPAVDTVDDEVRLEVEFVAEAVSDT